MGQAYLLHFHRPYRHARHYLGFVEGDDAEQIVKRIERHRNGDGARLMEVIVAAGITFDLARVWRKVDRNFERRLKRRHGAAQFCPICRRNHGRKSS